MNKLRYPFVPLPIAVVDDLLPQLKDTEMRILLVVLRQTLGLRDRKGDAKTRDWLTHSQLRQRTGRASAAVCAAVDELVKKGLIQATDESGLTLFTPSERRRARGRLYYEPGKVLHSLLHNPTEKRK